MNIDPTLGCQCNGLFLVPAFAYDQPPAGETSFDLKGQTYRRRYDRCTLCGHWFARHDLDLGGLYERDYVEATYGGPEGMRQKFEAIMALPPEKSDNRQRVTRVSDFMRLRGIDESAGPRLLDVGAGLGVFPAAMQAKGWQATALEPDARTVCHLREVAGVPAEAQALSDYHRTAPAHFELITFNKVLEHVANPVDLLANARALLLHHGCIYVEVPDVAAEADGPGREEFFIEHLHIFSPASCEILAACAGFRALRVERIVEPSGKFTLYCFMEKAG